MVNAFHKSEVEINILEKVKAADDHLNPKDLKKKTDHRDLLQETMLRHHQNKTNDCQRH
jgi:hypothetical protein